MHVELRDKFEFLMNVEVIELFIQSYRVIIMIPSKSKTVWFSSISEQVD